MKSLMRLLLHLFSWYPGSRWINWTGAACLAGAIVAVQFSAPELANRLVKISFITLFAFHYLGMPAHLRYLLANKRLGLVPGFKLTAGLAALLFTLMTSVFYQAMTLLLRLDTLAPGTALFFFIFASGYMAYTQLTMASRYSQYYLLACTLVVTYILFIIAKKTGMDFVDAYPGTILAGTFLACAGWGWGLYYVATRDRFEPPRSVFMPDPQKEGFQSSWESRDRHPRSSTTSGTLMLGFPDGLIPQLKGGVLCIIVFPASMGLVFVLMNTLVPGDPMPPFTWTFLVASGFLGGCCTLANGEFAARSRMLWLRYGSDRRMLWRHMETVLLRNWCCMYAGALFVAALAALSGLFGRVVILNYLLFIPVVSFYLLYVSMVSRITAWPGIIKALIYLGTIGLIIWALSRWARDGHFYVLNGIEVMLVLLGLVLRTLARNSFLGIDWLQVRPFSLAAIQGLK